MAAIAGFQCGEWVSEFQINHRGKSMFPYHVVLPAKKWGLHSPKETQERNHNQVHDMPAFEQGMPLLRFEVENLKHRP